MEIKETLNTFRNKAGCLYTEHKAYKALAQLKLLIDDSDYQKLRIGFSHFRIGEGAGELYDVCKEIEKKYCNPL